MVLYLFCYFGELEVAVFGKTAYVKKSYDSVGWERVVGFDVRKVVSYYGAYGFIVFAE